MGLYVLNEKGARKVIHKIIMISGSDFLKYTTLKGLGFWGTFFFLFVESNPVHHMMITSG